VLVHRANRLLSESTLILCTLGNRPGRRQTQLAAERLDAISTSSFSDSDPYFVSAFFPWRAVASREGCLASARRSAFFRRLARFLALSLPLLCPIA
jgi:hypothetical protein